MPRVSLENSTIVSFPSFSWAFDLDFFQSRYNYVCLLANPVGRLLHNVRVEVDDHVCILVWDWLEAAFESCKLRCRVFHSFVLLLPMSLMPTYSSVPVARSLSGGWPVALGRPPAEPSRNQTGVPVDHKYQFVGGPESVPPSSQPFQMKIVLTFWIVLWWETTIRLPSFSTPFTPPCCPSFDTIHWCASLAELEIFPGTWECRREPHTCLPLARAYSARKVYTPKPLESR